jgi:hypothetical protein
VLEHQCEIGNVQDSEIWLDIRGYEGKYQVSNFGKVKSLARERRTKGGGITKIPERIMKLNVKKDSGRQKPYIQVMLRNGETRNINGKNVLVHRLVADVFIKKLEKGEQVDHINGKHGDNRVENLRVMYFTEHIKLHPCFINPLPHDPLTGKFLKKEN